MKTTLVLIAILCLSSNVFGWQAHRMNYYYYEMDAGPLDVIQLVGNVSVNVHVFDDDNFQKYKDGKPFSEITFGFNGVAQTYPAYVVPSKAQH